MTIQSLHWCVTDILNLAFSKLDYWFLPYPHIPHLPNFFLPQCSHISMNSTTLCLEAKVKILEKSPCILSVLIDNLYMTSFTSFTFKIYPPHHNFLPFPHLCMDYWAFSLVYLPSSLGDHYHPIIYSCSVVRDPLNMSIRSSHSFALNF